MPIRLLGSRIAHTSALLNQLGIHGAEKNKNERHLNTHLRYVISKSELREASVICARFDQYYPQEIGGPKDQGRLCLQEFSTEFLRWSRTEPTYEGTKPYCVT